MSELKANDTAYRTPDEAETLRKELAELRGTLAGAFAERDLAQAARDKAVRWRHEHESSSRFVALVVEGVAAAIAACVAFGFGCGAAYADQFVRAVAWSALCAALVRLATWRLRSV